MRTPVLPVVVVASLVAVGSSSAAARPDVVHLVSITTAGRTTDVPPKGPSKGDSFTTTSRLLNVRAQFGKPKGAVVGSDRGTVVLTSGRAGSIRGVTKLPGGTITFRGALGSSGGGGTIPVVGGSGVFACARGTLTVTTSRSGIVVNVYTLSYPPVA